MIGFLGLGKEKNAQRSLKSDFAVEITIFEGIVAGAPRSRVLKLLSVVCYRACSSYFLGSGVCIVSLAQGTVHTLSAQARKSLIR